MPVKSLHAWNMSSTVVHQLDGHEDNQYPLNVTGLPHVANMLLSMPQGGVAGLWRLRQRAAALVLPAGELILIC